MSNRWIPKKFNGKMSEPMMPFFAAGLIVAWGVNSLANAMYQTDEWKFDPRNPNLAANKAAAEAAGKKV